MRELRSAVIILVEASWDERGSLKRIPARHGGQVCQRGMYTGQHADRGGIEAG